MQIQAKNEELQKNQREIEENAIQFQLHVDSKARDVQLESNEAVHALEKQIQVL